MDDQHEQHDERLAEVIAFPGNVGWGGRPLNAERRVEPEPRPARATGAAPPAADPSDAVADDDERADDSDDGGRLARLRERIRRIEAAAPAAEDGVEHVDAEADADADADADGPSPAPVRGAAGERPRSAARSGGRRPRVAFVETDELAGENRDDSPPTAVPHRRAAADGTAAPARRAPASPPAAGPVRPAAGGNLTVLPGTAGDAAVIDEASEALVRWLGRAPRSVRDSRHFLRDGFEQLGELDLDRIVDRMLELGYLDDRALAEQLRDGRLRRRSLGRAAMARELREIGIDDLVIDEVLGEPDRDAEFEQALELARSRARRVSVGDRDTAFRRLHAYLARRGYGGELATRAVRQALDEDR